MNNQKKKEKGDSSADKEGDREKPLFILRRIGTHMREAIGVRP
jgi:hypothetical protein